MSVRGGATASSTPLRTPLRDELNINDEDSWMSEGNERLEKQVYIYVRTEQRHFSSQPFHRGCFVLFKIRRDPKS